VCLEGTRYEDLVNILFYDDIKQAHTNLLARLDYKANTYRQLACSP